MEPSFSSFLARFSLFRDKLEPVGSSKLPELNELYKHLGVGWFKGNLLHILDPIFIKEIREITKPIQRLEKKVPFAINAFGDLFLWDPLQSHVEFFDFSSNQLNLVSHSISELLNEKLYTNDFHPFLQHQLVSQLIKIHGPLTSSETYHAQLPIILGGEKIPSNYQKNLLITNFNELVPIILQWEAMKSH